MARNKEFDEDAALGAAIGAFRRDGYERVSIKVLEKETGLSSGSLYNSFGDKKKIFIKALGHYNEKIVRGRVQTYLRDTGGTRGIKQLFLSMLEEPEGQALGCLLTNSAVEFGAGSPIAREGIEDGMSALENGFKEVLKTLNITDSLQNLLALKLLTFYQGVLVLLRSGRSRTDLESLIVTEIDMMFGEKNV